jgi:hypothetical protein
MGLQGAYELFRAYGSLTVNPDLEEVGGAIGLDLPIPIVTGLHRQGHWLHGSHDANFSYHAR